MLQFIEGQAPGFAGVAGAVEELEGDGVVEAGGAVEAGAPLGTQAEKELYQGPAFGPDVDGVLDVVFGGEAGAGEVGRGGQPVVGCPRDRDQFPSRPSVMASR